VLSAVIAALRIVMLSPTVASSSPPSLAPPLMLIARVMVRSRPAVNVDDAAGSTVLTASLTSPLMAMLPACALTSSPPPSEKRSPASANELMPCPLIHGVLPQKDVLQRRSSGASPRGRRPFSMLPMMSDGAGAGQRDQSPTDDGSVVVTKSPRGPKACRSR